MKRISFIILHCSSLTRRWYEYYHLEELIKNFNFSYWDCSSLVYPHFTTDNSIQEDFVEKLTSIDSLEQKLKNMGSNSLLAIDIHRCEQNLPILRMISKYRHTVLFIDFFSNTINQSKKDKFIDDYTSLKNIRRKYFSFLISRMLNTIYISCKDNATYRINHPDFETYLQNANKPMLLPDCKYIVYLDNNFPFHPEIKYREPSLNIDSIAEGFYQSLNVFFDKIEKHYACKIIIAAHPAAMYKENPYGGRKMIANQTGLLVRDSMGVLMHTSNAVSFAYLYNKPVVLLYNQYYKCFKLEYRRLVKCGRQLKLPLVDTDCYDSEDILQNMIDEARRNNYIGRYLVDLKDKRSNKVKLIQYIRNIACDLCENKPKRL